MLEDLVRSPQLMVDDLGEYTQELAKLVQRRSKGEFNE
jgi:hypothetical protein